MDAQMKDLELELERVREREREGFSKRTRTVSALVKRTHRRQRVLHPWAMMLLWNIDGSNLTDVENVVVCSQNHVLHTAKVYWCRMLSKNAAGQ